MIFAFAVLASTNFDALDSAMERCDRGAVNPAFASEAGRRSQLLTDTYEQQAAIVADRLDVANRRRALREAGVASVKGGDSESALALAAQAIEDRQRALNDRRMLEALRSDAMDAKRRYYLAHCADGKD